MLEAPCSTTSTLLLERLFDAADQAVWREFDSRYRPIITRFARRLGLRSEDAADVAQESLASFVRAYRQKKYDRERGRLRSWLMSIVKRRVCDLQRRQANHRPARGGSAIVDLEDEAGLEELWEAERRQSLLRQALAELKENSRTREKTIRAFELYVLKQRAPEAVAAELDMTVADVYMAKNRVAERLREIVARLDGLFDDG